jgi:hypothetical protein
VLAAALALPASISAASPKPHHEGTWKLADGSTVVLSKANDGQIVPLSQGYWQSGCVYAVYGSGGTLYSYTIWQVFGSDGSKINYLPAPDHSSRSDVGYILTSGVDSHWWVNSTHKDAAAKGVWAFTQYINGHPFRSVSGWVQVNDKYNGTWGCQSS